ncbi:MAG: family 16 glycoside hydrolase [Anaerolineales bacterium]
MMAQYNKFFILPLVLMLLLTLCCNLSNLVVSFLATPTPTPTATSTPTLTPTPTATPTHTPTPQPTPVGGAEWIVYVSQQNSNSDTDIYAIRVDGSGSRRLTDNPGNDWAPDLSPDGRKVVFVSDRDGNKNLYMVNIDGSGLTQLTYTDKDDFSPDWSPDGQSIAFVSSRTGSNKTEIWTARVTATGLDLSSLKLVTYDDFNDYDPAWSPDGKTIAYSSFRIDRGKGYTILLINVDGSQQRRITTERGWDRSPRWSPDGQHLIFVRWSVADLQENRNFWLIETTDERLGVLYTDKFETQMLRGKIHTTKIDGTETRQLTGDKNDSWAPCWSPDGQWIAFTSDRDGDDDIYLMRADGTQITPLTRNSLNDFHPTWGGAAQVQARQWKIIFNDSFDDNRNDWPVSLDIENEYWFTLTQQVTNGVYRWEGKAKQDLVHWAYPDIRSVTDFRVSVSFRQVSGDMDAQAGVVFRLTDNGYYMLKVSPESQEYVLDLWHNGQWVTLIDWTPTSAILPKEWNRIEVEANGSLFTIWINGVFVDNVSDSTLARGKMGVMMGFFDPGDEAIFEFDNFEVRVP